MIQIKNRYFDLEIERKNIKNLYLRLRGNQILITCPKRMSETEIKTFIKSKEDWIIRAVTKQKELSTTTMLKIDDTIFFKGKKYRFYLFEGANKVKISDDSIIVYSKQNTIESALKVFYKEANKYLLNDIRRLETKYLRVLKDYGYMLEPEYKFRIMTSKWGVCYTNRNQITINSKLIHFEDCCLEMVLWHELLHFIIPNHSKRFHELMEYHLPEYKEIQKLLH